MPMGGCERAPALDKIFEGARMKKLITAVAVATVSLAVLTGSMMMNADAPAIEWQPVAQALVDAPKGGKLIVLDVYTDWCGWCKRMDRDTYADSNVVSYIKAKYVASKMNPEKKGTLVYDGKEFSLGEFSAALGIRGYPATVFFNQKGEVLTMVAGYMKPDEFLKILRYFGEGAHEKGIKFEDFTYAGENGAAGEG